jgi:multicomponent Na+:H+ antiporter subunit G
VIDVITIVLVVCGLFFLTVSAYGLLRFPDFFTRAHVVAKSETFGIMLVLSGVIVHHRGQDGTLRFVLLIGFALIANPTSIHALARAALGPPGGRTDDRTGLLSPDDADPSSPARPGDRTSGPRERRR